MILAPLAGGPCTPELVAAVCNHGGLGSVGAAYLSPAALESFVQSLRRLTDRPFAINLFIPQAPPAYDAAAVERAQNATVRFREELQLPRPEVKPPFAEDFDAQFQAMLRCRPTWFSFVFGRLPRMYRDACRKAGIGVIGTATTLEEARLLHEDGVDAIVLQGWEAGGHRGIFDTKAPDPDIACLDLVRSTASQLPIPVIAAGGIMDGIGIAAALQAGAAAAQLGTAFLLCDEAGTSEAYRRALVQGGPSRLTRAFSGRLARGLVNRFMEALDPHPEAILPFPVQNTFTRDLRKACTERGWSDCLSLWAGTGVRNIRSLSAGALTDALFNELAAP